MPGIFECRRYKPQKLPGHTKWTLWDAEKRTFVVDGENKIMKFTGQGKALAHGWRLENAEAV